jgi:hypothetical protein
LHFPGALRPAGGLMGPPSGEAWGDPWMDFYTAQSRQRRDFRATSFLFSEKGIAKPKVDKERKGLDHPSQYVVNLHWKNTTL